MADLPKLGEDEIALYDRQIRLWGLEAQTNIRSARVLLINIGSIGTEITKNIVLSGIGHFSILDNNHVVTEEDLGSQFLLSKEDVGKCRIDAVKERIMDLNPRVELTFEMDSFESLVSQKCDKYDIVIATELNRDQTIQLNDWTRSNNIPLYTAGSNGLFGYIFIDLIKFEAKDKKLQSIKPSELGVVSTNKEIVHLDVTKDPEDEKRIYENIVTMNKYIPFNELLSTACLEGKLTRRQLKRVSSILPLTLAHLKDTDLIDTDVSQYKDQVNKMCEQLRIDPALILKPEYIEQFITQHHVEYAPVAAILGGAVAQDVINILGKRQQPLNNFIIFDGITLDMPIFEF
ncbi:DNA damage tolerance protein RHC31 [Monosporozyma servazzii]